VSQTPSFFRPPENVDVRNSTFNQAGSQIFIGSLHGLFFTYLLGLTEALISASPNTFQLVQAL